MSTKKREEGEKEGFHWKGGKEKRSPINWISGSVTSRKLDFSLGVREEMSPKRVFKQILIASVSPATIQSHQLYYGIYTHYIYTTFSVYYI